VIAKLNPPKKEKTAMVEDNSRHLRSEKSISTEKLSYGVILKTGKRLFTDDETLMKHCFSSKHFANTTASIRTKKKMLMISVAGTQKCVLLVDCW
jgi:hypothetical protein